jgi:uncharacterized protein YndB with AHSA1/START domain
MLELNKMEQLHISAKVEASASHTWNCYTDPKHIVGWNFADPSWCCPWAENDLRVGGSYTARMEAKDGSFGFDFGGIYDRVEQGTLLAYHLGDDRKVEVRFSATEDGGCLVETDFDPESQNPIEMQQAGWQMILNNFKTYCENNAE